MKDSQTKQYLTNLRAELDRRKISNIDDILQDYEDFFAQSAVKGYSSTESIRRLPSVQELAEAYSTTSDDNQTKAGISGVQSRRQLSLLIPTLIGDLLLLPVWGLGLALLACFGAMGVALALAGILMPAPDSLLGSINVPDTPLVQLPFAASLLFAGGTALLGLTLIVAEHAYRIMRWSLSTRLQWLTGRRISHLKFVPMIHKKARLILYKVTIFAALAAVIAFIALTMTSLISNGTSNFLTTWTS